jgi:serine protease Do
MRMNHSEDNRDSIVSPKRDDVTPSKMTFVRVLVSGIRKMIEGIIVVCIALFAGWFGSYAYHSAPLREYLSFLPVTLEEDLPESGSDLSDVAPADRSLVGIIERSSPSVVSVVATKDVQTVRRFGGSPFSFFFQDPFEVERGEGATERRQVGSGTGFFVDESGLIVTNRHVVSDEAADYTVLLDGGREYEAVVLARDPVQDIAVLRIEPGEGEMFPSLSFGDSDSLRVGQTVVAIGNSLGEFSNSVSRGIVSGLGRSVTAGTGYGKSETLSDIIQTDAAINPGNSGGPLLDLSGSVVGVNVAVAQGAENVGFAIPANQIRRIVDDVRETGRINTPFLGVRYAMIDEEIQAANSLPYSYGAIIVRGERITDLAVVPESPADRAGIIENDIILEIGGMELDTDHPLGNVLSRYRASETVELRIWHKGEEKTVSVTLEERL